MVMMAYQYEMLELCFPTDADPQPLPELTAAFTCGEDTITVKGFYTGDVTYRVRFLPKKPGIYAYQVKGVVRAEGRVEVLPAREGHHGMVKAKGIHFIYEDGTAFHSFGTTVYALAHQSEALIHETMETLKQSPFNKVRLCVFPKSFLYNSNEPRLHAFEKREDGSFDPSRSCYAFWDAFEARLRELFDMGIQVDLILFHPYDRWGYSTMPQEDNLRYLDYLLRRLAAWPNLWWSLSNEYDLFPGKSIEDWCEIETFVAQNDPFHHLLGNHNCYQCWDASRPDTTHVSWQTRGLTRIPQMQKKFRKPVCIDECGYDGNLFAPWGALTGKEMTARFWRTHVRGGYCTHGETFTPDEREIVFWAKGGKLVGESPARIAFLREIMESLPGPLDPWYSEYEQLFLMSDEALREIIERGSIRTVTASGGIQETPLTDKWRMHIRNLLAMDQVDRERYMDTALTICGHYGQAVYLYYYDIQQFESAKLELPEDRTYRIDMIDTWNMTRETVQMGASGTIQVKLPSREYMAVLAVAEEDNRQI